MDHTSLLTLAPPPHFEVVTPAELEAATPDWLDALPFGVIGLDAAGIVVVYNATESRYAGLRRERVLGKPFFLAVGVCMNNYLVAQRFEDEPELDATVPYVLTFRMRPTPVRLRLLRRPGPGRRHILIDR